MCHENARRFLHAILAIALALAGVTQLGATSAGERESGREVTDVRLWRKGGLSFRGPPDGFFFNVYRKVTRGLPVENMGHCLYDRIGGSCNAYALPGEPDPGELWLIQVTAVFEDGEGPMGVRRRPAAPCVCGLPPDPGPCDAAVTRWYRPLYGNACQTFTWGGCGGNANNFESEEACAAACLDTCILPPHPSDCCSFDPRWFFSVDTGRCEPFISGGCVQPPYNAFPTREDCEAVCMTGE